jgi:hypothetical protein
MAIRAEDLSEDLGAGQAPDEATIARERSARTMGFIGSDWASAREALGKPPGGWRQRPGLVDRRIDGLEAAEARGDRRIERLGAKESRLTIRANRWGWVPGSFGATVRAERDEARRARIAAEKEQRRVAEALRREKEQRRARQEWERGREKALVRRVELQTEANARTAHIGRVWGDLHAFEAPRTEAERLAWREAAGRELAEIEVLMGGADVLAGAELEAARARRVWEQAQQKATQDQDRDATEGQEVTEDQGVTEDQEVGEDQGVTEDQEVGEDRDLDVDVDATEGQEASEGQGEEATQDQGESEGMGESESEGQGEGMSM